jgi:hypothetical protein
MATPNRYSIVGDCWKFVAEGKVREYSTGKELNAKLIFNAATTGVETTEVDGERVCELHCKLVPSESNGLWEMVILDQE